MEEQDEKVSLHERLVHHARATARYNVYFGRGRDRYDVRGRVAHESLFNAVNGTYRGPATQQGYSPFTTWTRGLAWAMLGFAEQLEFLATVPDAALTAPVGRAGIETMMLEAAQATADYYLEVAAADGVPYWDTGAPGLAALDEWGDRPSDPFNDREPVDSSAAAIATQGLLRLARVVSERGHDGARYEQASLRVLDTLLDEPYLSTDAAHGGSGSASRARWRARDGTSRSAACATKRTSPRRSTSCARPASRSTTLPPTSRALTTARISSNTCAPATAP